MHTFVGSIPGWLTLIVLLAVARLMLRGGTGTAVAGLTDTNRELERQVHERDAKLHAQDLQIAELRGAKDVTIAILPVLTALENHEKRASERSVATLTVLDLIANRLGPDRD